MAITSYYELKLVTATTNAADEFLIAVPIPSTDFVFSDGPPSKYPIKNAANMNIMEAINVPVPNTARKVLIVESEIKNYYYNYEYV